MREVGARILAPYVGALVSPEQLGDGDAANIHGSNMAVSSVDCVMLLGEGCAQQQRHHDGCSVNLGHFLGCFDNNNPQRGGRQTDGFCPSAGHHSLE
jgi:hypothetical protein